MFQRYVQYVVSDLYLRNMGSLNFGTNVQPKASSGGDDLLKVFAVDKVEKKLAAAKIRLVTIEIAFHLTFFIFLGWSWKFLPGWKMFHSS